MEVKPQISQIDNKPSEKPANIWTAGRKRLIALNVLAMVIIVLGLFVGVNYLAARYYYRRDCTFRQTYALSDKTKNILKGLTRPVTLYALLDYSRPVVQRLVDLLEEYKMNSSLLTVEITNLLSEPTLANARLKYLREELKVQGVLQPNDIIFLSGNKSKVVNLRDTYTPKMEYRGYIPQEVGIETFKGEEAFTSALLSVIQEKKTKLYFIEGHGEPKLEGVDNEGLAYFNNLLKGENMETQPLHLRKKKEVPADADILVICGPAEPFLPDEINLLGAYLEKGGKMLIMIGAAEEANLEGLLKGWGVILGNDVVLDQQGAQIYAGRERVVISLVNDYGTAGHPITKDLKERGDRITPFVLSRSLQKIEPQPAGLEIIEIARSSEGSYGETDVKSVLALSSQKEPTFDRDEKRGPLTLAFAVKKSPSTAGTKNEGVPVSPMSLGGPETRLVVMGSSEMLKNRYLYPQSRYYMGPNDLVLNSIRWLGRQEQFITIEPKKPQDTSINLAVGKRATVLLLVSLVFIPALSVILGIIIWLIRRK